MRILHLSDLHLGTEGEGVAAALVTITQDVSPDLVIVSGDFTQNASKHEFASARSFIGSLRCDFLGVPGNHDIPGSNLYVRFFKPYHQYRTYIADDLNPTWENERVRIMGLNTARRFLWHWNWANGAIATRQRQKVVEYFNSGKDALTPQPKVNICFFHHPVHKIDDMPLDVTVFGYKKIIRALHEARVDLVLTGHVHHASIKTQKMENSDHKIIYLSASTALSSRLRQQENGFNLIDISENDIKISIYTLISGSFQLREQYDHIRNK